MLPQRLAPGLRGHLARARVLWQGEQAAGRGGVAMPDAFDRKYSKQFRRLPCLELAGRSRSARMGFLTRVEGEAAAKKAASHWQR